MAHSLGAPCSKIKRRDPDAYRDLTQPCTVVGRSATGCEQATGLARGLGERGLDLFGGLELHDLRLEGVGVGLRPLGDDLAGAQDARSGNRELLHAPRDEERREQRIGRGLAAHAHHDAFLHARLDDVLDGAQDRRIVPAVEVGDLVVATVGGHGVTGEVVRADGEERGLLGEQVGDVGGSGRLHHDADLDVLVELVALGAQLFLALLDERLDRANLLDAGDERHHDLDVAECARAEKRAQLHLVLIGVVEAVAHGAIAHERVIFLLEIHVRNLLVAAHIERTDDDRSALERDRGLAIGLELLVLGGKRRGVHEQELGAEESDRLGVVVDGALGVLGVADVAGEHRRP